MRLVTYEVEGKVRVGIQSEDERWVYPLKAFGMDYRTMQEVVEEMSESEIQLLTHTTKQEPYAIAGAAMMKDVRLLAPIPVPKQDVICLGINYMAHAEESARYKKEAFGGERPYAIYFSKRVNEAVGDGGQIPSHADIVDSLDYESELAVIIGRDAKDVPEEEVQNYIFGYSVLNDVSARNVQTRHKQWYFGKSLDGFTAMGPCIVTADAVSYPPKLSVQSYVNGELRQDGSTEQLIFDINHIVSELSRGMTLKAGTIISTGTPAGVGMGFDPPRFLKAGDVVECRIEGIGNLRNEIV